MMSKIWQQQQSAFIFPSIDVRLEPGSEPLTAKLRMMRLLVGEVEEERSVGLRDGFDGLVGVPGKTQNRNY